MKWLLIALGALVVLAIAALAAIPYFVDLPQIHAYVAQSAAHGLGRPVKFSDLSLSLLPLPAVVLKDLEIGEDPRFGSAPFVRVGEGRIRLRLAPLLSRRVEFAELTLEQPRLQLIRDGSGQWNMASLGASSTGGAGSSRGTGGGAGGSPVPVLVVSRLRIVDGAIRYQIRPKQGPATEYRVEGMKLTLEGLGSGAPVAIEGEAQINPGGVAVRLSGRLGLSAGGAGLTALPVKADVSLEAKDMAALTSFLLGPSPDLSGPVKGRLAITGTLGRLALAGQLDSLRLTVTERRPACPPPETRRLTLDSVGFPLHYDATRLTSAPLRAALGGGSVALSLDLSWEATPPLLSLKEITIRALPLAPVLVDYLCQGYAVSGPLDLTGELSGRPGNFLGTLNGHGQLRIGAGKVVGPAALALLGGVARLGGALSSAINLDLPLSMFSSPLEFQSITATYRIADGRLATQDFLYTSERMKVAAAGQYGLRDGRMNFDLTVKHGRGEIKAKVTGTSASPSIRVQPGTILRAEPEKVPDRLKKFLEGLGR